MKQASIEASQILKASNTQRWGRAWIALCMALAVHIMDEALNDFLSVYNPTVLAIRQRFAFLRLPTFTHEIWLTGLFLAVASFLGLSLFVYQGRRWMIPIAYAFASLMLVNGLVHMIGTFYFDRLVPGVYSSPLLLAASAFLLIQTHRWRSANPKK